VIVSVETPVGAIVAGLKALLSVTFGRNRQRRRRRRLVGRACALVTAFAGIVLTWLPTRRPHRHAHGAGRTRRDRAAVSATLVAPEAAVTEPLPHVVEAFGVAATSTPLGNASVTARLVSARARRRIGDRNLQNRGPSSEIAAA